MFYTSDQVKDLSLYRFAYVQTELNNSVFSITLNRPEKKNAMNPVVMNEIAFALQHAHSNDLIRVVVLKANGTIFCAGADLSAFEGSKQMDDSTIPAPLEAVRLGDAFRLLYKPCIAQVHAPVYAGGFLLLGGCTHVIASENAVFGLPEVKRGLWPFQVMASLMPFVPARTLLDWCMRGLTLDAEQAYNTGLVTEITTLENLEKSVSELAGELIKVAPVAIKMGLEAFDRIQNLHGNDRHAYLLDQLSMVLKTEDAAEGLKAFREKRDPVWKGR